MIQAALRPVSSAPQGECAFLKKAEFPVTVRVTINRHNVRDLPDIARLLLDDIGHHSFSTNSADRFGSARCYGQDVILSAEEWHLAVQTTKELLLKYPGRIGADAGPLAFAENVEQNEKALCEGRTGLPGRGKLSACGGVFSRMSVLHDGSMVPCSLLPAMVMGKIGETSLQEVWLSGHHINLLRERSEISITAIPGCEACRFAGFCTGGCPAVVFARYQTLRTVDQENCYKKMVEDNNAPV
jgi:SynChlorMet cassette radical SAM/SPASM protein ScmE